MVANEMITHSLNKFNTIDNLSQEEEEEEEEEEQEVRRRRKDQV